MADEAEDLARGTGRSTGLLLQAVGRALLERGQWVEFRDHAGHKGAGSATHWAKIIGELAVALGIDSIEATTRGSEVWVISLAPDFSPCGKGCKPRLKRPRLPARQRGER